ncbi:MAG: hypothetical protein ACFE9D_10895 [Promethearchaeota archaeon]
MELLNIIVPLMMTLDWDWGQGDPDMWSHMFPFMFFYGMPMIWLGIVLFVIVISATIGIVLFILLKEQQQGQA